MELFRGIVKRIEANQSNASATIVFWLNRLDKEPLQVEVPVGVGGVAETVVDGVEVEVVGEVDNQGVLHATKIAPVKQPA